MIRAALCCFIFWAASCRVRFSIENTRRIIRLSSRSCRNDSTAPFASWIFLCSLLSTFRSDAVSNSIKMPSGTRT